MEQLLLLLREQSLGCDNQWHEYFEDVSRLRGASNYPTVIMTLKNRRTSGTYDGSDPVLNSITIGWEPRAEDTLLTDLEASLNASMNTPGSSTVSEGPQNAANWQSPYSISNMLNTNTRGHGSAIQHDNYSNSFSRTSLGNYEELSTEYTSSSPPYQSHDSQHLSPYVHLEASPNTSHYDSIDMGQPASGGFSLDLNIVPRPEEVSSMVSSSADPITNPACFQQSLGTMPYLSGHPHESPPEFPFIF